MPAAGGAAPVAGVPLADLLLNAGPVAADLLGMAAVMLIRRHEPEGVLAVLVFVPVNEYHKVRRRGGELLAKLADLLLVIQDQRSDTG